MVVKASVKKALQEVKRCFPGQLLSRFEQRTALCIPIVADSLAQLLYDCDNDSLQVCGTPSVLAIDVVLVVPVLYNVHVRI